MTIKLTPKMLSVASIAFTFSSTLFLFNSLLPRDGERKKFLDRFRSLNYFFDSPHNPFFIFEI